MLQNLLFYLSQELQSERDLDWGEEPGKDRVSEQRCSDSVFFKSVSVQEPFFQKGGPAEPSMGRAVTGCSGEVGPSLPVLCPLPLVGQLGWQHRTPADTV